jgi:hypothetical protein
MDTNNRLRAEIEDLKRKQASEIEDLKRKQASEIECLKRKQLLQNTAINAEHEKFIMELIEKHEKEKDAIRLEKCSQEQQHSRTMENYMVACSNALQLVKEKKASDFL